MIDQQLEHANKVVTQQTQQIREITAEQTSKGFETVKSYTGDYANLASEYIGKSRQKIPVINGNSTATSDVKDGDFPKAPAVDFPSSAEHTKPVLASPGDGDKIAVSAS